LKTTVEPKTVPLVWKAVTEAWKSLGTAPPISSELAGAKARVRLRLARRQDQSDEWLDEAGTRQDGSGPIRDLILLAELTHVRSVARTWSETELAMVVDGGKMPDDAPSTFTKVLIKTPEYYNPNEDTPTLAKDTKRILDLAVKAIGDRSTFAMWKGYEVAETWKGPKGLAVRVSTLCRPPNEVSRTVHVLGTRISTRVQQAEGKELTGTETVGDEKRELTDYEATSLRSEANRHPLALLAAWVQGKIEFRLIALRMRNGREVALFERADPKQSRLRISIETKSGLLRTVETIRHRAGTTPVLVRESYDDYRRLRAFRVPMHRITKVGGDKDGVDSVVQSFKVLGR